MNKITKRILGIVMTSAIFVSGALSCSAISSIRWLSSYKYNEFKGVNVTPAYDKEYTTVYYPEGDSVLYNGQKDEVIGKNFSWKGLQSIHRVTRYYIIEA